MQLSHPFCSKLKRKRSKKDKKTHHGVVDKSSLKQQICGWTLTPFIVTKTGPTLLTVVGIIAGTKADEIQVDFIFLKFSAYC